MITLTDQVRTLFTPTAAAAVERFFNRWAVDFKPADPGELWSIIPQSNEIRAFFDFRSPYEDQNVTISIFVQLPDHALTSTSLPDEKATLFVSQGKVWTYDEICMVDAKAFYAALFALDDSAYERICARLRVENPEGWANWPRWPDECNDPTPLLPTPLTVNFGNAPCGKVEPSHNQTCPLQINDRDGAESDIIMTKPRNGTTVTDLDNADKPHTLTAEGYAVRHIAAYLNHTTTCITWTGRGLTETDPSL